MQSESGPCWLPRQFSSGSAQNIVSAAQISGPRLTNKKLWCVSQHVNLLTIKIYNSTNNCVVVQGVCFTIYGILDDTIPIGCLIIIKSEWMQLDIIERYFIQDMDEYMKIYWQKINPFIAVLLKYLSVNLEFFTLRLKHFLTLKLKLNSLAIHSVSPGHSLGLSIK